MDKILIVDSLKNTELLSKLLDNRTCKIFTSETGNNALAKIKMFSPDLIIMDVDLPDISGYDICKKLKKDNLTQDIIILLLSSLDNKQAKIKAFSAGADDFLEKNFDSFILISKVKSLLRIKYLRMQLLKKYAELEEKNNMLAKQLEMAQHLQKIFIPEMNLHTERIIIYSKYLPAMYIGGDFYDLINIDQDNFCVILGDVSGHGISAALLTAMLNNMIKNIVKEKSEPDKILEALNQKFILDINTTEVYACVFIAVINTKEKKIYYSNAGQPMPIFIYSIDPQKNKYLKAAKELFSSGTPIGLIQESKYESKKINYNSGDIIFFHTDGLENNFYKNDTDRFSLELKKILSESAGIKNITLEQITQNALNKFFYGSDFSFDYNSKIKNQNQIESESNKNKLDNLDNDDVSIIICKLL